MIQQAGHDVNIYVKCHEHKKPSASIDFQIYKKGKGREHCLFSTCYDKFIDDLFELLEREERLTKKGQNMRQLMDAGVKQDSAL